MDSPGSINGALAGVTVAAAAGSLALYWRSKHADRVAAAFGAQQLAAIRMLVCGVLLANALWEDLSSTARLPTDLAQPMGFGWLVHQIPGSDGFYTSAAALTAFQVVTVVLLALGAAGLYTRVTLPAAAVCAFVLGAILREYSHFFHTCLLPLWIAGALCFMPCADAWSLDRVRHAFSGRVAPRRHGSEYGWYVVVVWALVAGAYFCAGVSKLRDGGLFWWEPVNIKRILLQESLNPMQFDWGISPALASAPAPIFGALGLAALAFELGYPTVLFWSAARRRIPLVALGFHAGTFFLQNILFFDLIVLQLVFVDYAAWSRRWSQWRGRRACDEDSCALTISRDPAATAARARIRLLATGALALSVVGALGVELYPFTSWQMFSGRDGSGVVEYYRVLQLDDQGAEHRADIEGCFPSLRDGRYRRVLPMAFDSRRDLLRRVLDACAEELARRGKPVRELIIEKWRWRFQEQPNDSRRGELVGRYTHRRVLPGKRLAR